MIIIIIIMSCRQHGYPWPSLATSPYHLSPLVGLQGYILCPYIAAVCKFELVVLLLHGHMWGSIGVHHYELVPENCHSWWVSKMQSVTLEERYAIKFCFKLGKNTTETYGMLLTAFRPSCMIRASVFESYKRFKVDRESVRDDERCGRSKEVHRSWLAKGLGLGLLCWGFKGVQQEIPREEASTLQIGSVAFPAGQYTIPQLHPCHRLRWVSRQFLSLPIVQTLEPCDFWLFPKLRCYRYETIGEMKEAVTKGIDTLTQEDFHGAFQKLLEQYKCIAAGGDYLEGD